jgi:probable rRNA maturation factor
MRHHEIFIAVTTGKYALDQRRLRLIVEDILMAVKRPRAGLDLIFVNDQSMIAHNRRVFGKNRATDVISFPWQKPFAAARQGHFLGDVLISIDRAYYRAGDYEHSFNAELVTYIIHGILHLIGYDDVTAAKKKVMFAEQDKIFDRLKRKRFLRTAVAKRK